MTTRWGERSSRHSRPGLRAHLSSPHTPLHAFGVDDIDSPAALIAPHAPAARMMRPCTPTILFGIMFQARVYASEEIQG